MRKFTRRRPRFARRALARSDSRQFNLCGYELTAQGGLDPALNTCDDPFRTWSLIAYPDEEPNALAASVAPRGIQLSRMRFKYCYTLRTPTGSTVDFYNTLFIRTALVIAPQTGGTPVVDANSKLFPLFHNQGDLPLGIKVIWRSLDRLNNEFPNVWNGSVDLKNSYSHPLPLERLNSRITLKEGQGLYWASEVVSGNPALSFHLVNDLVMSYRLNMIQ